MESLQTTSTVFMVRPAAFGFNAETARDNLYQKTDKRPAALIQELAIKEFDHFVQLLREKDIQVIVVEDTPEPVKPDAVFSNNWFSTHPDGRLVLYPICSPVRRKERRKNLVSTLSEKGFKVEEIVDLTFFEEDKQYLESTGSLVMDRINKRVYACLAQRTHPVPLAYFCRLMGFEMTSFKASYLKDGASIPIYHTNFMMHLGTNLAVICLDSLEKKAKKREVQKRLEESGRKIVPISIHQHFSFTGNMLELHNEKGQHFTVMSQTALGSLKDGQRQVIEKYTEIIAADLPTFEKWGGGSARCMLAEIFLPKRDV